MHPLRLLFDGRLRVAGDQCPRTPGAFPSLRHTAWKGAVVALHAPVMFHNDGFTQTVVTTRWLLWQRTWASTPPAPLQGKRWQIVVQEWVPPVHPGNVPGWRPFGAPMYLGLALAPADPATAWSTQARRHLRVFNTAGVQIRLGSLEDIRALAHHSPCATFLRRAYLRCVERHQQAHPGDVEILIAEHRGVPIAGFVAAYCADIGQTDYLVGVFDPAFARMHAMVGLINIWREHALARGCPMLNFGILARPTITSWYSGDLGYSLFKTHFGARRIWYPGSFWRVWWG